MKDYFSADWHLRHKNILKYDTRPFKTIDEMDEAIMKNVCSLLKPEIISIIWGFCYDGDKNAIKRFMKTLVDLQIFSLLRGNHDSTRDTAKLYRKYGTYLG